MKRTQSEIIDRINFLNELAFSHRRDELMQLDIRKEILKLQATLSTK